MEGREDYLKQKEVSAKMGLQQPVRIPVTAPTPPGILEEVAGLSPRISILRVEELKERPALIGEIAAGIAPPVATAKAVPMKVEPGTITSFRGGMPSARCATSMAAVPLVTAHPYCHP